MMLILGAPVLRCPYLSLAGVEFESDQIPLSIGGPRWLYDPFVLQRKEADSARRLSGLAELPFFLRLFCNQVGVLEG